VHYGGRVRLESVDNAVEQANTAAADLLGIEARHERVPWFWSDQYEHKMVIVGLSQGHDQVVLRGDPASGAFSCCYLRGGELLAIDTINVAKDHLAARKLIPTRLRPDPSRLADPSIARQRRTLAAMGAEGRIAGHLPLNLPMEVLTDPVAPRAAIIDIARRMVGMGAEAVILGCAGMAGHRAAVEEACGVPVIEPCQAAAALALQAVIAGRAARMEAAA
jgi:hypothetical protein